MGLLGELADLRGGVDSFQRRGFLDMTLRTTEVDALVRVAEAAGYYQERRDAVRQGVVVRDMDEAREGLRAALERLAALDPIDTNPAHMRE